MIDKPALEEIGRLTEELTDTRRVIAQMIWQLNQHLLGDPYTGFFRIETLTQIEMPESVILVTHNDELGTVLSIQKPAKLKLVS